MCDFPKCTRRLLTLIWSLPRHLQGQRPGKDLTCILMQCSHMEMLSVTYREMDVENQSGHAFVTSFAPFGGSCCQVIHRPLYVKPADA